MLLLALVVLVFSYLIGAVPVGALVARANNIDISRHGSGKTGTTNVLRTVGRRAAALVLVGDFAKGSLAVVLARLLAGWLMPSVQHVDILGWPVSVSLLVSLLATAAVVTGHVWSIYLRLILGRWHGGRGVATALGAVLVVNPWILLAGIAIGVPTILISRYVSLGSILGATAAGVAVIVLVLIGQLDPTGLLFTLISVFIIAAHRDNIQRLLSGTERKLGERVKL
jgi:glycerol-3-phosphate acyltransferase PlsY